MNKWQNDILELLLEAETVTVPELQKRLNLTYDMARKTVSDLEEDGLVKYAGGISYCVDADKVKDVRGDNDMMAYLARRREELLKRLDASDDDDPDEDNDEDEENDDFDFEDEDFDLEDNDDDDDDDFDSDEALLRRLYKSEHEDDDENSDAGEESSDADEGSENKDADEDEDEVTLYIRRRREQLLKRLEEIQAKREEEERAAEDENGDSAQTPDASDESNSSEDVADGESADEDAYSDEEEYSKAMQKKRADLLARLQQIMDEREASGEDVEDDEGVDDSAFFREQSDDDADADEEADDVDEEDDEEFDDDVDEEEYDEDDPLRMAFDEIAEEREGADEQDILDDETSGFLTPNTMMFYESRRAYSTSIRAAYEEKSKDKLISLPAKEIKAIETRLASCFKLDALRTANSGGIQVFFLSDLYLPDGVCYAPSVTMNDKGEYFLHHPLIDHEDENRLCIRQDFYMLLKRHGMFFGDGTLVKQFLRLSDAMSAAMEHYGALCEAKIIIDRM